MAGEIDSPLEVEALIDATNQKYGLTMDEQTRQNWVITSCIESAAGANPGDSDKACKGLFQVNDGLNFPTDPNNQDSILYKLRHNGFPETGLSAEKQSEIAERIQKSLGDKTFAVDHEANYLAAYFLSADDQKALSNVKETDPFVRQYAAHLTGSKTAAAILDADDDKNLRDVILAANKGNAELTDKIINGNARLLKSYFHPGTNPQDESAFEVKTVGDFKRALKADQEYYAAGILKETTLYHPSEEAMGYVLGDIKEHDADTAKKIEDKIKAGNYVDAYKDLNTYYDKVFKEAGLEDKRKDASALILTNSFGPHDTIAMLNAEKEGKGDATLIKDITSKEAFDTFIKRARGVGMEVPENIDFEKVTVTELRNMSKEVLKGEQRKAMASIHDGTAAKGGPGGGEAEKDGNGWLKIAEGLLPSLMEGGMGSIMLVMIAFLIGTMFQGNGEKKAGELGTGAPSAPQQKQADPFAVIGQMAALTKDEGIATLVNRTNLLDTLAQRDGDTQKALSGWLKNGQTDDATIQKIMSDAGIPADQQKLLLGLNGQQKEAIWDAAQAFGKMTTGGVVQYQDAAGAHTVDFTKVNPQATAPTAENDAALRQFAEMMRSINAQGAQGVVVTGDPTAQTVPANVPPAAVQQTGAGTPQPSAAQQR